MNKFKFQLNQEVLITISGEIGQIIGRAEYVRDQNCYYVHFVDGTKCSRTSWINEDLLTDNEPNH